MYTLLGRNMILSFLDCVLISSSHVYIYRVQEYIIMYVKSILIVHSCCVCRQLYYCCMDTGIIIKTALDQLSPTVFKNDIDSPTGIAIDNLHSRVCWISFGK